MNNGLSVCFSHLSLIDRCVFDLDSIKAGKCLPTDDYLIETDENQ